MKNRFLSRLGVFCAFLCAASSVLAQLEFNSANLNTPSGPISTATIDINGNGFPGAVTANFGFRFGGGPGTGGGTGTTLSLFTNDNFGDLSFSTNLPVGLEPAYVTVADFNGDGFLDLVCANVGSNSLTVLTNNRLGSFVVAQTCLVGSRPVFVATADVNGDGFVDLICANYLGSSLTVLTNDGHGHFTFSATITAGANPTCLAAADINGDGSVDLVCVNSGVSMLQTFTNNGKGVFASRSTINAPSGTSWVIGADVDGNGSIDLITANSSTNLSVFTNDGSGNFNLKSSSITLPFSGTVCAADMNNDGRIDLICNINNNGPSVYVEVLTNDGAGNFTDNTDVGVGIPDAENYPNGVATADFNHDGNMDIAVACYGTALLTQLTQTDVTTNPIVAITSPANDAVIPITQSFDIDVSAESPSNIEVAIYFLDKVPFEVSTNKPFSVLIPSGRVATGTHALQVEVVDSASHIGWSPEVQINIKGTTTKTGGGQLTFTTASLGVGSGPVYILPVDLNGDGHLDLVTANFGFTYNYINCIGSYGGVGSNVTACINNGSGSFSSNYSATIGFNDPSGGIFSEPTCVTAGDFYNDGQLELIATSYYVNQLRVLTNNGKGVFSDGGEVNPGARGPIFVTNADFNGDGRQDLVSVDNYDSVLCVLTNAGDGTFPVSATLPTGYGPVFAVATDINGDGSIDLVCANYGDCGDGNTLCVYTNDGHANFTSNATLTVGYAPVSIVAADFNGDGFLDLISANQDSGTLSVFFNDGHGNFTLQSTIPTLSPSAIAAADLNGDGSIDLAVAGMETDYVGTVTIFLNDGHGNFTSNTVVKVGTASDYNYLSSLVAADFSGNGKRDLAVANFTTSTLAVLTQTTQQKPPPPAPVVTITSPTNAQYFPTNVSFTIKATAQNAVGVGFYLDGVLLGTSPGPTYLFQVPAGSVAPGGHFLQAIAVNSVGVTATSAVVQITLNTPGTALINFDVLNTSAGAVGGTLLANYLAAYGVTLANVTIGTAMEAVDTNSLDGAVEVEAPSSPNIFTQAGLNEPVSFTLRFATNLQAFGFTRAGVFPVTTAATHPQWTATAFDINGTELSSVTEALIDTTDGVSEQSFLLIGNGIASVRFDSDSQQIAAFPAVLLDDLLLDYNAVVPLLSVSLAVANPPTNDIIAPATITLNADVTDLLGFSNDVTYFAGATPLGTSGTSPYQVTWYNVMPGHYSLTARVVDVYSGFSAVSAIVPITVQVGPNSTAVNFDTINTTRAPATTAAVEKYLAGFGISVASLSAGTQLTVENQKQIAGGQAALPASPPNLLTQTGSSGPVQFTLHFAPLLRQFGFTRPELLANPFVSHPAWQVTAFDASGAVIEQAGEAEIDSSTNVGASEFSLGSANGPGIAEVEFASEGTGLTTFNAMLLDNLVLTTNAAGVHFPPAVAITSPASGVVLARPPALTVTAVASDTAGIASVSFYANGFLLGTDTTSPYTIQWAYPRPGNYGLTAVASNTYGLAWTSAVVNVLIQPSAYQFAISSQPASQTVPVGGSATFAVVATGASQPTYQWYYDNIPIFLATSSTLVLNPPVIVRNAGSYTVTVTSQGQTLTSAPPAILTVIQPPDITVEPQGQTVPAGSDVDLNVTVAGSGPFTYQWLLNGNSIPGATDSSYFIESAQPRQSGNYQVAVADQAASVVSTVAPVIVETAITIPETNTNFASRASINPLLGPVSDSNDLAVVQKGAPLPDGIPGGNSIWFTWTPTFTGTVSLTTQGSDFDTVMAVYTGTELSSLKAVEADDDSGGYLTSLVTFNVTAGTAYQIAVDGNQGASGRVVLGLPAGTGYRILNPSSGTSVPVITKNPASEIVAPGANATFSVLATSASKLTYQWYFQGAPISGATGGTLIISHVQPGSLGLYNVLVANIVGSVQSELASLQISANQGGKATSTGSKFVTSGNAASPTDLATELRPFALGGDTGGFSASQVFSTVGAMSEPGQPEPCGQVGGGSEWFVYTAPADGMMQVSLDGSTFNTLLGIYTGPGTSFASLDEVGCGYSTNYLTEGQPSVVIPNVAKGTVFYFLVEGYQGATGVAQLHIGLGKPLVFQPLPSSQLVTAGTKASFEATAFGSTPIAYQWQLNGANLPGATKSSYLITEAQDSAVGNYTVIASNVLGTVTSSPPAQLTLQYAPAIVAGPSNETVTLGLPAKFSVEALGINVKTNPFVCQWYFDGAPLHGATSLDLSLPVTRWTNNGTYELVISNSYGSTTSEPATLTLLDKIRPTVLITSPTGTVTNGRITVAGTAADNVGVAEVQAELGTNGFRTANTTNHWTNWFITVALAPGPNVISAQSVDLSSNLSLIAKRTITYKAPGSDLLPYRPDRSLSAASGTYSGLFYPATEASRANSGFFTATVTSGKSGAFTANILLDSGSYPFVGKFDSSGHAQCVVPRTGKPPLTASLQLNLESAQNQMTGVISSANWRSILQANRVILDAATNSVPVGEEQFALIVPSGATAPAGYLAITNTTGGTALVTGTLADGANIFRAAALVQGQSIPLYAPLYSGQGLFLAWITFTNSSSPANLGPAIWIGPGFTNLSDVIIVK